MNFEDIVGIMRRLLGFGFNEDWPDENGIAQKQDTAAHIRDNELKA